MWWEDPFFKKKFEDKDGNKWLFKVWHGNIDGMYLQKIFFWNEGKNNTGFLEFKADQTIHFKRIKDRILKLIKNKTYRDKYICELKFPIEKNYP